MTTSQSSPPGLSCYQQVPESSVVSTNRVRATKLTLIHTHWFILLRPGPFAPVTSRQGWPAILLSRPRNQLGIPAAGLDTRIRSKFNYSGVASQNTLLKTNGSHDRCTIDFARFRPLIRLRPCFVMLSSFNKPESFLPPITLPGKRCFTFYPMRPPNAMRSPPSDLAKRELCFLKEFFSHSRSEESGLRPNYRYPW